MEIDLEKYLIFQTVAGSRAYGVATPESDVDLRGVCVPPKAIVLSPFKNFEQVEDIKNGNDRVVYSLLKFVNLACKANPSLLELLYIGEEHWTHTTKWWAKLREARELFLSTQVVYSFGGYAAAQLKRMRNHKRWVDHAPTKPEPEDFGLSHAMLLGEDEIGAYEWLTKENVGRFAKDVVTFMGRLKAYKNAVKEYKQYQNWRATRNPARAKLEREHGYDCKHAYHLVRLARLGEELLTKGTMTVTNRHDRDELAAVRRGEWSYEQVLTFADAVDANLNALAETSPLPSKPKRKQIDALTQEILEGFWEENAD